MPHGNVDSMKATAQNAVTEPETSGPDDQGRDDKGRGENAEAHGEAKSYAAPDFRDASMAAPAAGEVGDYADLDEPSGGMAQGRTHTNREAHAHHDEQGPKTQAANKAMSSSGSPDQGTH